LELPREDYTQTKPARKFSFKSVVLLIHRTWSGVHASCADLINNTNIQIAADSNLTRKPHVRREFRLNRKSIAFEFAHRPRIAFENLNPARSTTRIPTTAVKNINACVFEYEDQFLPLRRIGLDWTSGSFSVDLWHL